MKRFLLIIVIVAAFVSGFSQKLPPRPNPPRLVNDFTNTLTPDQVSTLERKLVAYDDSTSNQIAIVIIKSTGDYDVADYAVTLGREWGIGNKKTNNGVLLLIAKDDRKLFIAPGYGLEGAIPDITAKSIIDNEIKPNFRENDYYGGLDLGTTALMRAAAGEYKAPAGYGSRGRGRSGGGGGSILGVIIVLVIVFMLIGRGGGGRGGGMMSRRGYRGWGGPVIFPTGGGLFGGGGGGFGGGSSGGGFGGFGGGSFGGGGAGGNW